MFSYVAKNFEIDLNGEKIKCRPWTTKQEREFLNLKDSKKIEFQDVLRTLVIPNIDATRNYSLDEYRYIAFKLRNISLIPESELFYTCKSCGQPVSSVVNLESLVDFKAPDWSPITVDDITIELQAPASLELLNKVMDSTSLVDEVYYTLLTSIKSVTYNGKTATDFRLSELEEFFDSVESKKFEKIVEEFTKRKSNFELHGPVPCPLCGEENNLRIDIEDFLW